MLGYGFLFHGLVLGCRGRGIEFGFRGQERRFLGRLEFSVDLWKSLLKSCLLEWIDGIVIESYKIVTRENGSTRLKYHHH